MQVLPKMSLVLLVGMCSLSPLAAQNADAAHYYKRCEGAINKTFLIVMHLQQQADSVRGYYYYVRRREVLFLSGRAAKNGEITLDEFPRGAVKEEDQKRTGTFKGRWQGNRFTGNWRGADGKKTLPFDVTETYGADNVRIETVRLDDKALLFPGKKEKEPPQVTLGLQLLYPAGFPDAAVLKELQRAVAQKAPGDPMRALTILRDALIGEYRDENAPIYEANGSNMWNWDHEQSTGVVLNEQGLLGLDQSLYDYTGGAHGSYFDGYALFDLTTGKKLAAADVFAPGWEEKVLPLIEADLRRQMKLKSGAPLSEAGFFDDAIAPAGEFYAMVDGIVFHYNVYEISPYVMGAFDVFLPWDKIDVLIKQESPVRRLMK
jgi:hypothetical protein